MSETSATKPASGPRSPFHAALARAGPPALACVAFAILACGVTYPLVFEMDQLLGRITQPGEIIDVGDGIAFAGYGARASRALWSGGSVWQISIENPNFTAPPGYLFPSAILTRVLGSPLVAHNVLLLGYTFLAFVCMFAFVRKLVDGGGALPALYAAWFYGSCNYLVHHLSGGHGNQAQIYLLPLAFLLTERVLEKPGWRAGCLLGGALALCAHSSSQYAVFLAVLLPLYVIVRAPASLRDTATLKSFGIAVGAALALCSYYLSIKLGSGTIERSLWENRNYVVESLAEFVDPNAYAHLGLVPLLLAGGAIAVSRGSTERGRVRALGAVFALSLAMTLGPMSSLHPYSWFYEALPVFKLMRTPIRFTAPAQMAGLALAGVGLATLAARLESRRPLRAAVLAAVFVASLISTPLLANRYYDRAFEPGHIWAVDVRSHPDYLQVTR